ncbi:AFG1 family ATPase [Psychromonas sp. CNPT3]|uniref:cell division protein ZapE n=1 Tax=Psychromonas sp. CNPT3 TaxID=314282 RepID=UPI00006E913B|nr:cell division protein ZapE [Psychromonas sp. CNPT3]AGH81882.1 AFG1 family ATPase [Psychromonas sp. CNPT3]
MTPLSLYQDDLKKPEFYADAEQAKAIKHLQRLYVDLQQRWQPNEKQNILTRLLNKHKPQVRIQGLYFYGGVGRGKTYLMDLFFNSLPTQRKSRLHFHHFMQQVHDELTLFSGQKNPLQKIAKKFAKQIDIICFDEFFVDDITDAMILGGIFEALFAEGVVLLATSNIHPQDLYKNGLQRARFLGAIKLLQTHCDVINLEGGVDYRLDRLMASERYYFPLTNKVQTQLSDVFKQLSNGDRVYSQPLRIKNRYINTLAYSRDTLLIEYSQLCSAPRGVADYIELSILYRTIIVVNITQMQEQHNDMVRRFIAMVDEFYNHHVVLIISADVPLDKLYQGSQLAFQFTRCISRLTEMQSEQYLQKAHHLEINQHDNKKVEN